jgi:hypothetical protein
VPSAQLTGVRESEEDLRVRQVMGLVKIGDWIEYTQTPGLDEWEGRQ